MLLQRLSGDVDSYQRTVDDVRRRGRVVDWTRRGERCRLDCVEALDRPRTSVQQSPSLHAAVKRQLDLNIVLSNYIKHRLGKDEDQ